MANQNSINPAAAILWASAFLIGALVIVQAGRLPGNQAWGEMTASEGSYRVLTTDSGRGGDENPNELLYVIDNRDQTLLVYEIEHINQKRIFLRDGGSLSSMFNAARSR